MALGEDLVRHEGSGREIDYRNAQRANAVHVHVRTVDPGVEVGEHLQEAQAPLGCLWSGYGSAGQWHLLPSGDATAALREERRSWRFENRSHTPNRRTSRLDPYPL